MASSLAQPQLASVVDNWRTTDILQQPLFYHEQIFHTSHSSSWKHCTQQIMDFFCQAFSRLLSRLYHPQYFTNAYSIVMQQNVRVSSRTILPNTKSMCWDHLPCAISMIRNKRSWMAARGHIEILCRKYFILNSDSHSALHPYPRLSDNIVYARRNKTLTDVWWWNWIFTDDHREFTLLLRALWCYSCWLIGTMVWSPSVSFSSTSSSTFFFRSSLAVFRASKISLKLHALNRSARSGSTCPGSNDWS